MPEFRRISKEEWEQYPAKVAGKPDEWEPVMAALEAGDTIELPASDDKQLRGMRIGLGRRAKQRGWQLEYRAKDTSLAVQRIASSPHQSTPPTGKDVTEAESPTPAHPAQRGRSRKAEATGS